MRWLLHAQDATEPRIVCVLGEIDTDFWLSRAYICFVCTVSTAAEEELHSLTAAVQAEKEVRERAESEMEREKELCTRAEVEAEEERQRRREVEGEREQEKVVRGLVEGEVKREKEIRQQAEDSAQQEMEKRRELERRVTEVRASWPSVCCISEEYFLRVSVQTKLELESLKNRALAVVESDSSELQTTLQLVAQLQSQLQTVREETAKREQAEVEWNRGARPRKQRYWSVSVCVCTCESLTGAVSGLVMYIYRVGGEGVIS